MIEQFLERLDKVRKSGKGYSACCPVHNDRSPSMTITEKDGKVLCYCFSCGATGEAVAEALGLPVSALFEDELIYQPKPVSKADMELYEIDRFCVMIGERGCKTYADFKRLKLARERIAGIENKLKNN